MSDSNPNDETQDLQGIPVPWDSAGPAGHPPRIGRYRIERVLGQGGFGLVYMAYDGQLDRRVAIKVPHVRLIAVREDAEAYLAEARIVANLDHPGIVPVHDIGSTEEFPCYIVSKYIDGADLATRLKQNRLGYREAAELVATVAEALHYAHKQGLVHRDVKPGNILIGQDGTPYVADFGLALREENIGKGPTYVGTPEYMSPEQARGEGHRVDGRSDVYSLGVVLYRMITGRLPCIGKSKPDILMSVALNEPKPPRQIDDRIPKELERICLRAIAKRIADRYTTAKDFADELNLFLNGTKSDELCEKTSRLLGSDTRTSNPDTSAKSKPIPPVVVPKGLRAFDEHDADFFLNLLPGPFDRSGIPERLRFLTQMIHSKGNVQPQPVGVIYGPSGSGKSSLIRAGLIPLLSEAICPVFIEATENNTEAAIFKALCRLDPMLKSARSIVEAFAKIRLRQTRLSKQKVVIFIDQFEQWLNARTDYRVCELLAAIRQCDGIQLQCVLSVRDDFWVAVSRLLREVEMEVRDGQNATLIDLFDERHARHVLIAIGRAYGRLPATDEEMTTEHNSFLDRALRELAERGHVVPVRLAVFSEMMKDKQWHPRNLEYAGGCDGIGVAFLSETFDVPEAPVRQRRHSSGAQRILARLTAISGADFRRSLCSVSELRLAAAYPDNRDFENLMTLLDNELRLLTPVAQFTESADESIASGTTSEPAYQLTHDYLVAPLRTWLAQNQRSTFSGRASLRLQEITSLWSLHRDQKLLPTACEWLFIRLFASARNWTETQRAMMGTAGRTLRRRASMMVALVLVVLLFAGYAARQINVEMAYQRLLAAPVAAIPEAIEALQAAGPSALARVRRNIRSTEPGFPSQAVDAESVILSQEQFRLRLTVSALENKRDLLVEQMLLTGDPVTIHASRRVWSSPDRERDAFFWAVLASSDDEGPRILRAAGLLAEAHYTDNRWANVVPRIITALTSEPYANAEAWAGLMMPVSDQLLDALAEKLVSAPGSVERAHLLAITRLLNRDSLRPPARLLQIASRPIVSSDLDSARRKATAAAALAELDEWAPAIEGLAQSPDPTLRTELVAALEKADLRAQLLLRALEKQSTIVSSPGVREGLLASLGAVNVKKLSGQEKRRLEQAVRQVLANSTESNESRAVCDWLLSRWNSLSAQERADAQQRMIQLTLPDDLVGNTENLPWRFEIRACAVTVEEFLKFRPKHAYDLQTATSTACPVNEVTWFDTAAFCNWLSARNGLPEDQWCYIPNEGGKYDLGMSIPFDIHTRRGYRLPTSIEWNYCSQAGSTTQWSWGNSDEMADRYAWSLRNSGMRTHPVGGLRPNPFGLFDMNGNVWEWIHDTPRPSGTQTVGDEPRYLRGGTFLNDVESIGFDATIANQPHHHTGADGFRVVRRIFE